MFKDLLHWDLPGRMTWGVLIWIFFNLLWLRFAEMHIPQWVGASLATVLSLAIIIFGPRPLEDVEEEEEQEGE